eukprot:scaffold177754_cov31-Tisochrysis_lutea.AAC.4
MAARRPYLMAVRRFLLLCRIGQWWWRVRHSNVLPDLRACAQRRQSTAGPVPQLGKESRAACWLPLKEEVDGTFLSHPDGRRGRRFGSILHPQC